MKIQKMTRKTRKYSWMNTVPATDGVDVDAKKTEDNPPPEPETLTLTKADFEAATAKAATQAVEAFKKEQEKLQKEAEKNRSKEETDKLKEAGETATLVAKLEADVAKLQGFEERAAKAEAILTEVVNRDKGKLPASVQTLLDAMPLTEQVDWLQKNLGEFAEAGETREKTKDIPGNHQRAKPDASKKTAEETEKARRTQARTTRIAF